MKEQLLFHYNLVSYTTFFDYTPYPELAPHLIYTLNIYYGVLSRVNRVPHWIVAEYSNNIWYRINGATW